MTFWIAFLSTAIILVMMWHFYQSTALQKKYFAGIRVEWGKPTNKYRSFKLIAAYLNINNNDRNVSAETAADIDMDGLYSFIDRTSSKPGEQYLYYKLHNTQTLESYFIALEQKIYDLNLDENKRERTQFKLSKLNHTEAYYLPQIFLKPHQSLFNPWEEFYIRVSAVVTIALMVLLIVLPNQFYFFLLIGMLITNTLLHFRNKAKVMSYTRSLPQLIELYNVGKWLSKEYAPVPNTVKQSLAHLHYMKRSLSIINLQQFIASDPTDLMYLVFEWLNMFLLIEPLIFLSSIKKVNKYLGDIKGIYEFVAEIDLAISIQSVRDGLPYYCKPNFTASTDKMTIASLYHPLVENCVPNSILSYSSQGALITGSNMSGKTTFIRAVTINTLLAQTLNTCCANLYEVPPLNIFTSIHITDDINTHKSYFQAEAISILNIIDHCTIQQPFKSLVVIDEIFRGTNTIERVAAAKAVLAYLIANKNFVFVSTHDLELAQLLGDDYAVYSFEEQAGNQRLMFDYKIKRGLLKNKNGIAVLQGMRYPQTIINDAYKVSQALRDKYEL